jgi:phosphate transport system permease protein
MLFGAPLALMAAIFSSEFLHHRVRARVKPAVEMMASLPSVVLGFLAALVLAPLIEDVVPEVLACFVTIPFALLLGAHLWQVLPERLTLRLEGVRFAACFPLLAVGLGLGALAGDVLERTLFDGDIKAWLTGNVGTGAGGWFLLLLPLSAVATTFVISRSAGGATSRGRAAEGGRALVRFVAGTVIAMSLALACGLALARLGLDPRGGLLDTYVQRNALVVGFVMGFAVIPIIYTIADDALTSVPEHLRSASLGCGATPWQTAVRIIVPTAMSGLFSALMIGLGRAVGETMIVLMAAGNTPVLEWNVFNGFRTLSANIAVEMPEAVKGSTHFRTLFLAALTLFAMTFVVNTAAEVVRLRFRKRAYQL